MATVSPITHKRWMEIEKVLRPCPVCAGKMKLVRSDGTDCRISRECRQGFYLRCWECGLLYGYEPDRGGCYRAVELRDMVQVWNDGVSRGVRTETMPVKITWAAARVNAGLKQGDVARQLGIQGTYLCDMERGRSALAPDKRKKMAKLYGVKLEWIREETP